MNKETDTYRTIRAEAEGSFKEKGSKFLAFAFPVESEEKVKEIVEDLKKKYYDARHHCYAYKIGVEEPLLYRMNDDGEPSGTAGKPIYGQILSNVLTNVLIVVVRYFGGTLLGTSGLIKAYKNAAADSLGNCIIIKKIIKEVLTVRFPYEQMNNIMRIVKEEDLAVMDQQAELDCTMKLGIRKSKYNPVRDRIGRLEKVDLINTQ